MITYDSSKGTDHLLKTLGDVMAERDAYKSIVDKLAELRRNVYRLKPNIPE